MFEGAAARAGTGALGLLATPLHGLIVEALADDAARLVDLRSAVGSPAQTTLRAHLRALCEAGVVGSERPGAFPGAARYELTAAGRDMLTVTGALRAWLSAAPQGPIDFETPAARSAIRALLDGWTASILRAIAARPLTLTELDGVISGLNYPALERRLTAMRLAGQVEPTSGNGRGTPYAVTPWLRRAVAPLAAAARWERRHMRSGATAPMGSRDAEAVLLLALPLVRLPVGLAGSCRLTVEMDGSDRLTGALAEVEEGRLIACRTRLEGHVDAWAVGSLSAWLAALVDGEPDGLEIGGNGRLVAALLDAVHTALYTRSF